jgi:hypothetical protein
MIAGVKLLSDDTSTIVRPERLFTVTGLPPPPTLRILPCRFQVEEKLPFGEQLTPAST